MNSSPSTGCPQKAQNPRLHFEAIEPRILFDASAGSAPTAEVSVTAGELTTNEDQLINDNIEFTIQFDNNGGQEGYQPYVDFVADPDMEIQSVNAFGTDLSNPDGAGISPIGMIAADGQLVDISSGVPIDHPQFAGSVGSPSSDSFGGAGSGTPPVTFNPAFSGMYVYSVTLPFGSFTPGNPPIDIAVEASLNTADGISPNQDYTLYAQGGYALGCDPNDNAGTVSTPDDAPIFGALASDSVHPVVMDLIKTAGVAEGEDPFIGENVSGPNHPVTYRLEVDVATGETVNSLNLTDVLPDDLAYLGNLTVTDGAGAAIPFVINSQPNVTTDGISGVNAATNTLDLTFPSVTGVDGADIIVTYDTFVPYVEEGGDLVINPVSGEENDLDEFNDAAITGDWNGQTVSDNAAPPANGGDPDGTTGGVETDFMIEEHSLAIQKGVDFADGGAGDRGAPGDWGEGDIAEFTLDFQISDYFAFDTLVVDDVMDDGLEFLPALDSPSSWPNAGDFGNDALEFRPELNFTMHGAGTITIAFDEGNFTAVENANGTTDIHFDVYQQLIDSGFIAGGDPLTGGMIPAAGIDPALIGAFNSGVATQGNIVYRAKIRDAYASVFLSDDPQINQGDRLQNDVTITGRNLDVETFTPGVDVTDDSAAAIQISTGTVTKELFSVQHDGVQTLAADLDDNREVVPLDVITWRLTYTLPSSEFEDLILSDFLPLPVFDEAEIDTSQIYAYGDPGFLTAGRISFGPNDTFFGPNGPGATGDGGVDDTAGYATPTTPVITLDAANNAFVVNFGDYTIPESLDPVATTIELFVSTTIQDGVYADGLFFTNQVGVTESNSFLETAASNEIALIELTVPDVQITKGVVAAELPNNGNFSGSIGPVGVTFNPPGSATAFSGQITSDGLASNPIDADNFGLDAGDLVTFGIVAENLGQSDYGAFDVQISDTLPNGFIVPATMADLNLRVTDGNGNPLAFTIIGGGTTPADFFANGIELTDPAADAGSLTEYDPTSGSNLVFVAYDVQLEDDVHPSEILTNVATVENFSYREGGANYAGPEDTDPASVNIARPTVLKEIIDTSHDDTDNVDTDINADPEVAIGEVVTYRVTVTIPEGEMPLSRIIDSLPAGMAFVGLDSVTFDADLTTDLGAGDFTDVEAFYNAGASTLELGINGIGPGLGTITNNDRSNPDPETVVLTYRAVVLNDGVNQSSLVRTNDAELRWTPNGGAGEQVVEDSEDVVVVEPDLTVAKTVIGGVTTVEGAQEITYQITVTNNATNEFVSEGYDVVLTDVFPAEVSYVAASVTHTGGIAPNAGTLVFDNTNGPEGTIRAVWDRLGVGESSTIEVTVRIDDALPTDQVITNTAEVAGSSLPGDPGDPGYTGYDPTTAGPNIDTTDTVYDVAVERTGDDTDPGGAANDYDDDDDAVVTVVNPVGIDKAIIDTAEAHTIFDASADGTVQGAIGEVIRYEVRIQIPQATNSQLQLVDTLDPNLFWIDAATNNLEIRLEGFAGDGSTLTADADIVAANGSTTAFDPGRVSFDALNNEITFNFGDITNTETDATPEFLYLSYNAIVRNDTDVNRGDVLTNTVQLREGGEDIGAPLTQSLVVVEPELNLLKSDNGVTTADAGDIITYTLTVTAENDATHTTAFDVAVGDVLPDELDLVAGSLNVQGLFAGSTVLIQTEDLVNDQINVVVDQVGPGESFIVEFQARVRDTGPDIIHSDETVTNTATLDYSTLPDDGTDDGTGDNTTGNESGTPDDEDGERTYTDTADDSFSTPAPTFQKVLGAPADTTFTIGEPVEYVLTIQVPEGRVGDPNAFILDTVDPGFRFVPGTLQVNLGAGITVGTAGALDEANAAFFTHTDPGDEAQSEGLRFDLGFIDFNNNGAGDGVNTTGTVEIRYLLQVENILANQEGTTLNNTADFLYTDDDGTTTNTVDDTTGDADTIVTIVEPQVNVDKQITAIPAEPDAGDTVSYQITMTHPGGPANPLFNTPAFDVTVRDVMPAGVEIQTGTFTATLNGLTDVTGLFSVNANGFTDEPTASIDMQPGDEIIITYDATITPAVRDGESLVNDVDIEWTSLDDDDPNDGIDGLDTDERTGDGDFDNPVDPTNPNDYENEDDADFTVDFDPTYGFTKTIISTSADHTGLGAGTDVNLTDLTIGESVTYALTATMGRGTTDGVRIIDQFDIANGRLHITGVQVQGGAALTLAGGGAIDSIVPVISDSAGGDGYNDRVVANFGTVVNDPSASNGIADEQITIFVTAVVVNDLENQSGDIITNEADFFFFADPDGDGTQTEQLLEDDVEVEIVEPELTVVKTIPSGTTTADAGDTLDYQIVVTNISDTDAFDSTFQDILPSQLDLDTATFTATRASDSADVSGLFTATADEINHAGTGFFLAAGDSITITYNATVLPTVTDGAPLTNEVDIEWTSLDRTDPNDGSDPTDTEERGGDGDPDNPADPTNPDDYEDEDDVTVTGDLSPVYGFTKDILTTSAAHTGVADGTNAGITDLVVGEIVTYILTAQIGEGTTPGVQISDTLDLANGILDIRSIRISGGGNLTTDQAADFSSLVPTITDSNTDTYFDQFSIDFGTVVNDASSVALADGQIRIEVDAVVVNVLENQGGDVINNEATFRYLEDLDNDGVADDESTITDDVDVEIVEPQVVVAKSIPSGTTTADAGDVIDYQIVLSNPGAIDAFDVTFSDVLPAQMDLDPGSFTAIRTSDSSVVDGFFAVTSDAINHVGTGFNLTAGDSITITYNATVLTTVTDGASLINLVDTEWSSLDDDDPTDGSDADERGGDGDPDNPADPTNPNDYEDESEAEITGDLSPAYGFSKTILSTSESHSGTAFGTDPAIEDLVIGETVTYQLVADMGRGTTNGVVIEDILNLTNGILDIRDVRISSGAAISLAGGGDPATIVPVVSDSNTDTYNDQVTLNLGTIVNDPSLLTGAPNDEQIIIEIDAVVVNILENQGGDVINNLGRLTVLEDTDGDGDADDVVVRDDNVDVEIVEPTLTVAKSITNVPANPDAQDIVSYQVVINNTGDIDSFDVTFIDDLPAKLLYDGNLTATRTSDGADVTGFFQVAGDNNSITHVGTGFDLAANDSITLTYDARITEAILDGERLTNLVDIEWTTTPGDNPDERGGDDDPNNPADPTNPDDHEAEDDATVEANLIGYDFDKSIFTTSMTHTDSTGGTDVNIEDLVVGESVTYALTATFAEGTTTGVVIADSIQIANGILDVRNVTFSAGSNLTAPVISPSISDGNGDGFNEDVVLNFGTIVNNGLDSVDPAADQLVIFIEAMVVNVIENQEGDVIVNDASLTFLEDTDGDGIIDGNDTPTVLTDDETVEIIEPNLSITKAVSNETPKLNEVVTYTLVLTNNAGVSTTDAFDLVIDDLMDPRLTLDPASVQLTVLGAPANPSSITFNNSTANNLVLGIDLLEEGESVQITYEVRVSDDPADFDAVLPNTVDLTYTSTPGDNPDERGGPVDPNDPNDPNDYDDTDDESVEVHQPDLVITKDDDGAVIRPGQLFDYTMEVTNQGRATALGVTVTDDISHYLAEGFQFVSGTNATISGGVVTFVLPDMAVDDVQTVTLTLRAPAVVPAGLEEIENIATANHIDIEPSPEDNTDDEPTPIIAFPDLVVEKDDGLTFATVGDQVTYAITFDNVGDQVASGVVITDTLPPGVQFISATDGGRLTGGSVVWEIDQLRPGDGDTYFVTVELLTDGLKINNVTIEDDGTGGPDPTPENNEDEDRTISEKGFQFDLNQNFLTGPGNTSSILDDFQRGFELQFPTYQFPQNSSVMYATYMNSGLAQAGSTITLEVYNSAGRLIGDTSVVADAGGNWLATFPMTDVDSIPARVVIKQTWASYNPAGERGYNFRTFFGPAFTTGTYYTEDLSVYSVDEKRAATEVVDLYESSKMILAMNWNGTVYEFAARSALQSSSGN